MVDPAVSAALIAGLSAFLSPVALVFLNNRSRRQEKEEDYARQDDVAEKAATTAARLLESQRVLVEKATEATAVADEAARVLRINTAKAAEAAKATSDKLVEVANTANVIHTLVNSTLTAAKQAEYNATASKLASLQAVAAMRKQFSLTVDEGAVVEIEDTKKMLTQLGADLADRAKQADTVAAQQKNQARE